MDVSEVVGQRSFFGVSVTVRIAVVVLAEL